MFNVECKITMSETSLPSITGRSSSTTLKKPGNSSGIPSIWTAQKLDFNESGTTDSGWLSRESPSPRPPPTSALKRTDMVRISKSEVERRNVLLQQLQREKVDLESRVQDLEYQSDKLKEADKLLAKISQAVGLGDSVHHDSLHQTISGLCDQKYKLEEEVVTLNKKMTEALGDLAEEKSKYSSVKDDLEKTKISLNEQQAINQQLKSANDHMRQTHARLSAQMECLQKRVDANKSNLSTQNSSTTSSQASLKEDLKQTKQELDTFMKEAHFFKGKCSLLEEQLKEQEEQLECNQELMNEFLERLSEILCLKGEDIQLESCINEIERIKLESGNLATQLSELQQTKEVLDNSVKANRETILRLVADGKQHEKTLEQIADMKKERGRAFACQVSAEHDRDQMKTVVASLQCQLESKEQALKERGEQMETLQLSLDQCKAELSLKCKEFEGFRDALTKELSCESVHIHRTIHTILSQRAKEEELQKETALLREEIDRLNKELISKEELLEEKQTLSDRLRQNATEQEEQLSLVRAQLRMQEASIKQHTDTVNQFSNIYKRLSAALKLDDVTADMLSGEFALDALVTRAQQLVLGETRVMAEKQATIHSLQRKAKSLKQSLQSKELHVTILQKKLKTYEERISSYVRLQEKVDSSNKKLVAYKEKCDQLQGKAHQFDQTKYDLLENEGRLQQLQDGIASKDSIIAELKTVVQALQSKNSHISEELVKLNSKHKTQLRSFDEQSEELHKEVTDLKERNSQLQEELSKGVAFEESLRTVLSLRQTASQNDILQKFEQSVQQCQQEMSRTTELERHLKDLEQSFSLSFKNTFTQFYDLSET